MKFYCFKCDEDEPTIHLDEKYFYSGNTPCQCTNCKTNYTYTYDYILTEDYEEEWAPELEIVT